MSTATLLILASRIRDHRPRPRVGDQSPVLFHAGLGRVSRLMAANRPAVTDARLSVHSLCGQARLRVGADVSPLPRHIRAGLVALGIAVLCSHAAFAQADQAQRDPSERVGGKPAPAPCVVVDIAGHKAGHLDCASQRLEEAARTAQAQARSAMDTPVIDARSPDVRTGVANQTATRQRMGNSFGTSVHPQRPNRPAPMPRPGGNP